VGLELLADQERNLFSEREIGGGISMVNKSYAKANNSLVVKDMTRAKQ